MGYLNNETISVDAILTKKGRELISRGDGSFKITQFALSDDEINYNLYNPLHPDGTASFGEAIEEMPIIEAFPDETQMLKYKLVTLPRGTSKLPILNLGFNTITLNLGSSLTLNPQTLNFTSQIESSYTATISDSRLLSGFKGIGTKEAAPTNVATRETIGTSISKTVVGTSFNLTATTSLALFEGETQIKGNLIVVGNDSGARISVPITIKQTQFVSST